MNRLRKLKVWKRRGVKADIKESELFHQIEMSEANNREREIVIVEKLKLQTQVEATLSARISIQKRE